MMSRLAGVLTISLLLLGIARGQDELCQTNIFELDYDDSSPSSDWTFSVGSISTVPNTADIPTYTWQPDGHFSVLPLCDGSDDWMMYWTEWENYRTVGTTQFPEDQLLRSPSESVFGDHGNWEGFDNGGSWLMSVHRVDGNELIGLYHAEDHWYPHTDNNIAWKSLAVAYSSDNGYSWSRGGQIITSHDPKPGWQFNRLGPFRGLTVMMSALEGEGGHGKADVVKEVE